MITRLLAACLVLPALPAVAQAAPSRLVAPPYPATPAWKEVTNKQAGAKFFREYIPADQKVEAYRDILSVQSFPELAGRDAGGAFETIATLTRGACGRVSVNGPVRRVENGVRTAYGQLYCNRQNGKDFGVMMFFKVMEAPDGLYVVQREFRVPPSEVPGQLAFPKGQEAAVGALMKATGAANDYLTDQVYLCGGTSTDKRCK